MIKKLSHVVILLSLLSIQSCGIDHKDVTSTFWKCCGDGCAKDVLFLDKALIRHDTIYLKTYQGKDSAFAVIDKTEKRWQADNLLYIKFLSTGKTGRYCDKGKIRLEP